MRKSLIIALSAMAVCLMTSTPNAFAAEKTVTVAGEGKCAKCAMKEGDECQNVIQVKEDGKTVTYYLAKNDVSDSFHKNVCKGPKKVSAKGTVKEVNGKKQLTVSEIKTTE